MHNIPLGGHKKTLSLPYVIRNMVAPHTQVNIPRRNPEVRKHGKRLIFLGRREHENKCRNVHRGGKVEAAVTDTTL